MHIIKTLKFISLLSIASIALVACKNANTNVDYDTDTNFQQFSFYQLMPAKPTLGAQGAVIGPTDEITGQRIAEAITAQLSAKALNLVETDADVQVSYFTTLENREKTSSFSIGIGGGSVSNNSATSVGVGTTIPLDTTINVYTQITIDFHVNDKLVWRGFDGFEAAPDMTATERQVEINTVVANILAKYPPK